MRVGPSFEGMAGARITVRDRELLEFAAEHRFFLGDHAAVLLGVCADVADRRLRRLARSGFLTRDQVVDAVHVITAAGVAVVGSDLRPPRLKLNSYAHDVGVAWVWLAARDGAFGPVREVIGERRLRSADGRRDPGDAPFGVRLGGVGPRGMERLHYPDLLLIDHRGRRVALELELTDKGRRRRERILSGYGADVRVDAVVYLVAGRALGRSIAASASRLGLSSRVYVQLVRLSAHPPAAASERVRTRTAESRVPVAGR